jgi:hypothetical protein
MVEAHDKPFPTAYPSIYMYPPSTVHPVDTGLTQYHDPTRSIPTTRNRNRDKRGAPALASPSLRSHPLDAVGITL